MTRKSIFTRIADREAPGTLVYEDEVCFAIRDIRPVAPVHILVIPREPIATLDDLTENHRDLIGHLLLTATRIARQEGIAEQGYRTVFNCKAAGGQTVYHVHLHLLGGRQFSWPPG